MTAWYNENDPKTAAWLRELIKAGLIADGEVDTRSIVEVEPSDLVGFRQCHFFAGIGGWSYALRLPGWPDERECWTGSCPCQPFSSAGAKAGGADARDLWPAWFRLVRECRPSVVFGEQVESAIGHGWVDRLCDDLEAEDYAVGPIGLPSASVGAFDIRQRLWFVADAGSRVADATSKRRTRERVLLRPEEAGWHAGAVLQVARGGEVGIVGESYDEREAEIRAIPGGPRVEHGGSPWAEADWLPCRDGKWRPVETRHIPAGSWDTRANSATARLRQQHQPVGRGRSDRGLHGDLRVKSCWTPAVQRDEEMNEKLGSVEISRRVTLDVRVYCTNGTIEPQDLADIGLMLQGIARAARKWRRSARSITPAEPKPLAVVGGEGGA